MRASFTSPPVVSTMSSQYPHLRRRRTFDCAAGRVHLGAEYSADASIAADLNYATPSLCGVLPSERPFA
jgi:hypothetical protein